MPGIRGVRGRLAATLVLLVTVTVLAIGVGTYAFVDARLREGLLDDASRQAQFNLSVLIPERFPAGVTREGMTAEGPALAAAFRLRGDVETIVDFGDGGETWVSHTALLPTLGGVPASVRATVAAGRLGYAWMPATGEASLVVAGRSASGPEFYFVFPAASIDAALEQLRAGLAAAALIALVVALATAGVVARGILSPVRSASTAAARMGAGDLTARVPVGGADEFADWAASFNRMADSLAATIDRLARSESQNRRFVADVSHELRTPLTALLAEASIIEPALPGLSPEARRAGELLVADVRRLRALVDDLMELSRFDARAEEVRLAPVDLGRVVRGTVAARLPEASVRVPDAPVVVESDVRRIDRILGNLLDNARAHAPGAPVEVSLRDGPLARVVVADRGPGVAPADLPHLFERFYKADPSRRGGSSGLGLAIAAEHAALLGGRLHAAARDGGGLEFTLELPARHQSAPEPDTGSLPPGDGAESGEAHGSG